MSLLKKLFLLVLVLYSTTGISQVNKRDFSKVDEYVKKLGSLDTLNMGTISQIVTRQFPDKLDKVRAIFAWIAYNISFDCKAAKNNNNEKNNSTDILKYRKATGPGYAALFQDMCSVASIRCLTVDGFIKTDAEDIGVIPDEFNHTWNVVQLGQSPADWFYVDPTRGSGYTDAKLTTFTRSFNDAYFFADKVIFNYQHFPDNSAWLLGDGFKNRKDFYALPIVHDAAYEFNLTEFRPNTGKIRAKAGKPVSFTLYTNTNKEIALVGITIGDDRKKQAKTVDYTSSGGSIGFSYKFTEEDSFPLTISINGKAVLSYLVEVAE